MSELAFDNPERVLHLCPNTGLELFCLFAQRAPRRVLVRLAFARSHRNVPIHACRFSPLAGAKIAGIGKHDRFFAMQQAVSLGHVIDVGRCADHGVYQARVSIDTNVRLHAEVPLVALLNLVHLGVTLTGTKDWLRTRRR